MENNLESKNESQNKVGTKDKRCIAVDEGLVCGKTIMVWAVVLLAIELFFFCIVGVVIIMRGDLLYSLLYIVLFPCGIFTSFLLLTVIGIFIKKISLIEQHLKKDE